MEGSRCPDRSEPREVHSRPGCNLRLCAPDARRYPGVVLRLRPGDDRPDVRFRASVAKKPADRRAFCWSERIPARRTGSMNLLILSRQQAAGANQIDGQFPALAFRKVRRTLADACFDRAEFL